MKDIWFISDTHFFHENILKFADNDGNLIRGHLFENVADMNNFMVERWNSFIKPGDRVYHLGDVVMGNRNPGEFEKLWGKLNGSKRLILGNHDDAKYLVSGGFFKKVTMWRQFPEHGFIASHVPLHESQMYNYRNKTELFNVHGHIHQNDPPTYKHINISVEKTDYKPIHLDTILEMMDAAKI